MANRLKAYCRRTILESAREYSWPAKRRTAEGTRAAFIDAMRGTDTGWWRDLIFTADMLKMAHRYRHDIATALAEYHDAAGEAFTYRPRFSGDGPDVSADDILSSMLRSRAWTFEQYNNDQHHDAADATLIGMRFAVEWYVGELAREYCPDL